MAQFRQRFGRFIDIIEPLQDFSLFQINVLKGRYIRGFAQAFELTRIDIKEIARIAPKSPRVNSG
jgi:putative heme iron utilization protein